MNSLDDSQHERDMRNVAGAVGMDPHSTPGIELGNNLAESGAKLARSYTNENGHEAVTFVGPDGKELDLTGVPAFIAGIVGGWAGYHKKR